MQVLKGISFPFRFNNRGGVAMSDNQGNGNKVVENIQQVLLTEPGQRVMEPEFGCRLRDVIFEPLDLTIQSIIKDRVTRALARWIPYIEVQDVVTSTVDNNTVVVMVYYKDLTTQEDDVAQATYNRG